MSEISESRHSDWIVRVHSPHPYPYLHPHARYFLKHEESEIGRGARQLDFLTNSDLSFIGPKPSILQSMS